MPTTGQMIKAMRLNRNYAPEVGADACMISKRCYYDIERGITLPNEAKLHALANRYRCDIDDLKGQDWMPDAERNRETEKARKEKWLGGATYRAIVKNNVNANKTLLNGGDVTKEQDTQLNVAAGMIEEGNKIEQEQGDTIKQLRERIKYLDGIIATKDEDIRTLKAQLEFAEAGIEDVQKDSDDELTELRKELEEFKENAKQTVKEISQLEKENKQLKAALLKVMLKQIEEQED